MPREVEYMNLLVIEDDRKLNRMLCEILEKEGYTVKACTDGEEGAYYLQQNDVVYVEPNQARAGQSSVNENQWKQPGLWISIASFLTTIGVLIFK